MTTVTLHLRPDVYQRLTEEAQRTGKAVDTVAEEWLTKHATQFTPLNERERAREILRIAGLLAEPSAEMIALAAQSTATLEEVSAALSRPGGQPLSEIILEQRGPKE